MKSEIVLVVDFDGTYVKNDFFAERLVKRIMGNPFFLITCLRNRNRGWLELKRGLLSDFTPTYPLTQLVNDEVRRFIEDNRSEYARVVLVSASPEEFVRRMLSGSLVFDEIYGSTTTNLAGKKKLEFILEKFGNKFHYIGDSRADEAILRAAVKGHKVINNALHEYR